MPDAAIITARYGGYDDLKPACAQQGLSCEHVLVTDDPQTPAGHLGWRVVFDPRPGIRPARAAKHPKFRPWVYTAAPASVWVDGSVTVTSPSFAADALRLAVPVAQFAHPDRDCIYDEATVSASLPRYAGEPVLAQAEHYRRCGHPEHWGLWAATVIARQHTSLVMRLGTWWTREVDRWSYQDQISQPYILRKLGLRPSVLPGYYRDNEWLHVSGSGKHW